MRVLLMLMLLGTLLVGCDEDVCDPAGPCNQPENFSLQITVQNPDGTPAANLQVSGWSNLSIPTSKAGHQNTILSSTILQFALPEEAFVQLDILDGNDQLVRQLMSGDDAVQAGGSFNIVWDVRDELDQALPNGLYRAEITMRDSLQNTLFSASEYGYYLSPSAAASIIATTDSNGQFTSTDRLPFPGTGNAPVMTHRDALGDSLGTFTATDSTTIALRNDMGQVKFYGVRLNAGANTLELTWSPAMLPASQDAATSLVPASATDVPDPLPPTAYRFNGFTPNPFN